MEWFRKGKGKKGEWKESCRKEKWKGKGGKSTGRGKSRKDA